METTLTKEELEDKYRGSSVIPSEEEIRIMHADVLENLAVEAVGNWHKTIYTNEQPGPSMEEYQQRLMRNIKGFKKRVEDIVSTE